MNKLRVIIKKAGEPAKVEHIEDTLEAYQELVGGYIQTFRLTDSILLVINEEGKLMDLPINFSIPCHGGLVEDIAGTVVVVSDSPYDGDFHSLDDEQLELLKRIGLLDNAI